MNNFIDKVKDFATGKTKEEREADRAFDKILRKKIASEERQERELQNIRIARERIKAKADQRIKSLRQPQQSFNMFSGYSSPFGQPRQMPLIRRPVRVPKKKGKSKVKYVYRQPKAPSRYDVISGNGGYRVI